MKKSNALWGALLIFIGLVWILDSTRVVSIDIWGSLTYLWPVFIIAAGITFFLKRESHLPRVILWILVFALIGGYGVYLGYNEESSTDLNKTFVMQSGTRSGSLQVNIGSADFDIDSTDKDLADIKTNIKGIRFVFDEGTNPRIKYSEKGQFNAIRGRQIFDAGLNNTIPWDVEINSGVTNGKFDLSDLMLKMCTINTGSCDLDIIAGSKLTDARIVINGGAVNLNLMLPDDVGLKISSSSVVAKVDGSVNMIKDGRVLYSDNFESAPYKLYLDVTTASMNITVNH